MKIIPLSAALLALFVFGCGRKNVPAASATSQVAVPAEDVIYMFVEQMPQFPGGESELMKFVNKQMVYPQEARDKGEEGRVVVQFVVTKEGKITNAEIVRSVSQSIDKEALRIINSMPLWQPGKQNGQPVSVRYTLPLTFLLE